MPIRKEECSKIREQAIQIALETIYKTIDVELRKNGYYSNNTLRLLGSSDTDLKVKHLKQDYENAGWEVKRDTGYDQRDGESWDTLIIS